MKALLAILALAGAAAVLLVSIRTLPPADDVRRAVASRLEPVIELLDERAIDGWAACDGCQPLVLRSGASTTVGGRPVWDEIDQAVDGLVPDGRLIDISVTRDVADPGQRTVAFTAAPRLWWGAEAMWDRWVWTWHSTPQSTEPASVDPSWTFTQFEPGQG